MEEIIKMAGEYGVLFVIAALFIWEKISHGKIVENVLKELQATSKLNSTALESMMAAIDGMRRTSENTATALSIIQNTLANLMQSLERHDQRSEHINKDVRAIIAVMNERRPGVPYDQ